MPLRRQLLILTIAGCGFLILKPVSAPAQPPSCPYGASIAFELNTNCIGQGDSSAVILTAAPDGGVPPLTALRAIAPNPFNSRTTISFTTATGGCVEVGIFDLRGQCVRRLVAADLAAGEHTCRWDGLDDRGAEVSAGVYLIRLASGLEKDTQKIAFVK